MELALHSGACDRRRLTVNRGHHRMGTDGRKLRMLNVVDEFSRECLAIRVARKLNSLDVIDVLADLFIMRGIPGHIRSDNGPEFVATAVKGWITGAGAGTAYIEPGRHPMTPRGWWLRQ